MQRLVVACASIFASILVAIPAGAGSGAGAPFLPVPVKDDGVTTRQDAILYNEDRLDPTGQQYAGTVVWRTERVARTNEMLVRADVEIPERKLKLTLSFRRNSDPTLPASHIMEFTFKLPQDFADGGVAGVPGLLTKPDHWSKATPLAGVAVKVVDSFFLFGLSNKDADLDSNLRLLKESAWLDIPLTYSNEKRAIVAVEIGETGRQAFADAFAGWGQ